MDAIFPESQNSEGQAGLELATPVSQLKGQGQEHTAISQPG